MKAAIARSLSRGGQSSASVSRMTPSRMSHRSVKSVSRTSSFERK